MSDERIVQFGGVLVELEEIRETGISIQTSTQRSTPPDSFVQKLYLIVSHYFDRKEKRKTHDQHL